MVFANNSTTEAARGIKTTSRVKKVAKAVARWTFRSQWNKISSKSSVFSPKTSDQSKFLIERLHYFNCRSFVVQEWLNTVLEQHKYIFLGEFWTFSYLYPAKTTRGWPKRGGFSTVEMAPANFSTTLAKAAMVTVSWLAKPAKPYVSPARMPAFCLKSQVLAMTGLNNSGTTKKKMNVSPSFGVSPT